MSTFTQWTFHSAQKCFAKGATKTCLTLFTSARCASGLYALIALCISAWTRPTAKRRSADQNQIQLHRARAPPRVERLMSQAQRTTATSICQNLRPPLLKSAVAPILLLIRLQSTSRMQKRSASRPAQISSTAMAILTRPLSCTQLHFDLMKNGPPSTTTALLPIWRSGTILWLSRMPRQQLSATEASPSSTCVQASATYDSARSPRPKWPAKGPCASTKPTWLPER
mmetsp:Transcript_34942/g.91460  ORF Transcript_34942/g.91460 Transcript_34942/m.91460 type:complete len:227 (+) Transcript_34942:640-1320(+)